jgi:hypothetical protein
MNKIEKPVESYSVRHLLTMHGEAFLSEAYRMLLGRQPDAEGKAYYLSRLRNGKSKLEVIAQLHNSPEGQAYPVERTERRAASAQAPQNSCAGPAHALGIRPPGRHLRP